MRLERTTLSEWSEMLPPQNFEVFHTPAALSVVDRHVDGELELFVGYRGNEPVALMPAVIKDNPIGSAIMSPPPGMAIPRMGPLMLHSSPKRRKQEKLNREFTELLFEETDLDDRWTIFRMICPPKYTDPRPFVWLDLDLDTSFTYHLNIDGKSADEILSAASKSLRREIRDAADLDVTIEREGVDGALEVYQDTEMRYRQQDTMFALSWEYVKDLVTAMSRDDRCRVYVARAPDGGFLSGITVLYSNDTAYFWQGGARSTFDGVSINSAIHWRIIQDLIDDPPRETVNRYDLMGANTERLCRYKSKFGADLVPYYVIESAGMHMDIAKKAYWMVAR